VKQDAIYKIGYMGDNQTFHSELAGTLRGVIETYFAITQHSESYRGHPADFMHMLTFAPADPDRIVLNTTSDPYKGEYVFEPMDPQKDNTVLCHREAWPAMSVLLEPGRGRMAIQVHGDRESEVYVLREEDAMDCYRDANNSPGALEENLRRLVPEAAERWQGIKGRNALYTITEGGESRHYLSEYGGTHFNTITAAGMLRRAMSELHYQGMRSDAHYLAEGLQYHSSMIAAGAKLYDPFLTPVSDEQADRLLMVMDDDTPDDLAMHVALDFDNRTVTFHHGYGFEAAGADITVSMEEAAECLEETRDELISRMGESEYIEAIAASIQEKLHRRNNLSRDFRPVIME